MSELHKCPVCDGSGIVPGGFYISTGGFSITGDSQEACRSCNGKGYIVLDGDCCSYKVTLQDGFYYIK